jgi:integrase
MAIVKGKGAKDGRCTSAPAPPGRWTGTSEREPRTAGLTWMRCSLTQRGALSPDGARERVKLRGAMAGIDDLHPHRFRHTFAHDFLMSGGQERDLNRLAGWSSDTMLKRYGASASLNGSSLTAAAMTASASAAARA